MLAHPPLSVTALRAACRVDGVITLFYYADVPATARWYEQAIGFEKVLDYGWLAIFRIIDHAYLGLVSGEVGSQQPIAGANKGAMVTIATRDLERWHRHLVDTGVAGVESHLQRGCEGDTLEFKIRDPGGYTLEFFQWLETPPGMRVED